MQPLHELQVHLLSPQYIAITMHQNPDADALGSCLALQLFFQAKGHTATVISSTPFSPALAWMPRASDIIIFEKNETAALEALNASSILCCLDFNHPSRTGKLSSHLENYDGIKVLIDHHEQPALDFFQYGLSQPHKSSTCEMVFDYIAPQCELTNAIADCIYAGCMTDTGGFRYSGTTASTHIMVAALLTAGTVPNVIAQNIYDNFEEKRLRLLGHILSNRLIILPEQNVAYMYLNAQDMQQYSVDQGDTEGIVNYPLSMASIKVAALFTQRDGEVRMSFRSKGTADVNAFARQYFNGGGHVNAAGGRSFETVETVCQAFETAIKEYSHTYILP